LQVGDEAEVTGGPDAVCRLVEDQKTVRFLQCRAVEPHRTMR
jgi:hypothetical protein